uniref:Peptidase S8/S53 domain-containing protein n=1 Tax=Quercus lobata TaxID=97700 RepID=A0A7N2M834_QUELO
MDISNLYYELRGYYEIVVAAFGDFNQPDITAPGVNILAAYHPQNGENADAIFFEMDLGTSMVCPHAAGIAATIKSIHRDWSPAANQQL